MEMAYEFNDLKGLLFLVFITIPIAVSTNIDCGGKPFHCLNSTHFMICVDLGGGVSTTIDDFIIPCPPITVCQKDNRFECEFPKIEESTTPLNVIGIPAENNKSSAFQLIENLKAKPPKTTTVQLATERNIESMAPTIEKTTFSLNNEILESLKEEFTEGDEKFVNQNVIPLTNIVTTSYSLTKDFEGPKITEKMITTESYLHNKLLQKDATTPLYASSSFTGKSYSISPPPVGKIALLLDETSLPSTEKDILVVSPITERSTSNINYEVLNSVKEEFTSGSEKIFEGNNIPLKNRTNLSPGTSKISLVSPKIAEIMSTNGISTDTKLNAETSTEKIVESFPKTEHSITQLYATGFHKVKVKNVSLVKNSMIKIMPDTTATVLSSTIKSMGSIIPATEKTFIVNNEILESLKEEFTGDNENVIEENITPSTNTVTLIPSTSEASLLNPKAVDIISTTNNYFYTDIKAETSTEKLLKAFPKITEPFTLHYDTSSPIEKNKTFSSKIVDGITILPDKTFIATVLSSTEKSVGSTIPMMKKTTFSVNNEILESLKEEFTGGNESFIQGNIIPSTNTVSLAPSKSKASLLNPKAVDITSTTNNYFYTEIKAETSTKKVLKAFPKIAEPLTLHYDTSSPIEKNKTFSSKILDGITIQPDKTSIATVLSSTEKNVGSTITAMEKTTFRVNNEILESLKEEFTGGNEHFIDGNIIPSTSAYSLGPSTSKVSHLNPKAVDIISTTNNYSYTEIKPETSTEKALKAFPKTAQPFTLHSDTNSSIENNKTFSSKILDGITIQPDKTSIATVLSSTEKNVGSTITTMEKTTFSVSNEILESLKEEFTVGNENFIDGNITPSTSTYSLGSSTSEVSHLNPKAVDIISTTNNYSYTEIKPETSTEKVLKAFPKTAQPFTLHYDTNSSIENNKTFSPKILNGITILPDETSIASVLSSTEKSIGSIPTMEKTKFSTNNEILESLKEEFTGGNENFIQGNITPLMNIVSLAPSTSEASLLNPKAVDIISTTNNYIYTEIKAETSTEKVLKAFPKIAEPFTLHYDTSSPIEKNKTFSSEIVDGITILPDKTSIATVLSSTEKSVGSTIPTMKKTTFRVNNEILESLKEEFTGGNENFIQRNIIPSMNTVSLAPSTSKASLLNPKAVDITSTTNNYFYTEIKAETSTEKILKAFPKIAEPLTLHYDTSSPIENNKTFSSKILDGITIQPDKTSIATVLSSTENYLGSTITAMEKTTLSVNNEIMASLKEEFTGGIENFIDGNIIPSTSAYSLDPSTSEVSHLNPKAVDIISTTNNYSYTEIKSETSTEKVLKAFPKTAQPFTLHYDTNSSIEKNKTFSSKILDGITIQPDKTSIATVLSSTEKNVGSTITTMEKTTFSVSNEILESLKEEFTGGNENFIDGNITLSTSTYSLGSRNNTSSTKTVSLSPSTSEASLLNSKAVDIISTTNNYFNAEIKAETTTEKVLKAFPINVEPFNNLSIKNNKTLLYIATLLSSTEKSIRPTKPTMEKTTFSVNNEILESLKEEFTDGEKFFKDNITTSMNTSITTSTTTEYTTSFFNGINESISLQKRDSTRPDPTITVVSSTEKYISTVMPTTENLIFSLNNKVIENVKEQFTGDKERLNESSFTSLKGTISVNPTTSKLPLVSPKIENTIDNPLTKIRSEILKDEILKASDSNTTNPKNTVTIADGIISTDTETRTQNFSLGQSYNLAKDGQNTPVQSSLSHTLSEITIDTLNTSEILLATSTQFKKRLNTSPTMKSKSTVKNCSAKFSTEISSKQVRNSSGPLPEAAVQIFSNRSSDLSEQFDEIRVPQSMLGSHTSNEQNFTGLDSNRTIITLNPVVKYEHKTTSNDNIDVNNNNITVILIKDGNNSLTTNKRFADTLLNKLLNLTPLENAVNVNQITPDVGTTKKATYVQTNNKFGIWMKQDQAGTTFLTNISDNNQTLAAESPTIKNGEQLIYTHNKFANNLNLFVDSIQNVPRHESTANFTILNSTIVRPLGKLSAIENNTTSNIVTTFSSNDNFLQVETNQIIKAKNTSIYTKAELSLSLPVITTYDNEITSTPSLKLVTNLGGRSGDTYMIGENNTYLSNSGIKENKVNKQMESKYIIDMESNGQNSTFTTRDIIKTNTSVSQGSIIDSAAPKFATPIHNYNVDNILVNNSTFKFFIEQANPLKTVTASVPRSITHIKSANVSTFNYDSSNMEGTQSENTVQSSSSLTNGFGDEKKLQSRNILVSVTTTTQSNIKSIEGYNSFEAKTVSVSGEYIRSNANATNSQQISNASKLQNSNNTGQNYIAINAYKDVNFKSQLEPEQIKTINESIMDTVKNVRKQDAKPVVATANPLKIESLPEKTAFIGVNAATPSFTASVTGYTNHVGAKDSILGLSSKQDKQGNKIPSDSGIYSKNSLTGLLNKTETNIWSNKNANSLANGENNLTEHNSFLNERQIKPRNTTSESQQIKLPDATINATNDNNKSKRSSDKDPVMTNNNHEEKITYTVNCAEMPRGKYADSRDCRKFYTCIGKRPPIIGTCPNNTVFSEINKQCTRNLSHCVRNNQFHCLYEGRFSDFLKNNIYYICVKNSFGGFLRYKLQCQNGFLLNKSTTKCEETNLQMEKQSISLVSNSNSSTERKKSILKLESSEYSENNEFVCRKEGQFPHKKDCKKYYVCTKNSKDEYRRRLKMCSNDEIYDRRKKKCITAESNEC